MMRFLLLIATLSRRDFNRFLVDNTVNPWYYPDSFQLSAPSIVGISNISGVIQ